MSRGVPRRFGKGAVLYRKGDMIGPFYWILRGEVQLTNEQGVQSGHAVQGEFVGEGELVKPSPARRGTAMALGELDVAEFDPTYIANLLKTQPALKKIFGEADAARAQAQSEMDDFLNRW